MDTLLLQGIIYPRSTPYKGNEIGVMVALA